MTFEEYLIKKKISKTGFQQAQADRYAQWEKEFLEFHPDSFSMQKLFLINTIRREHPLLDEK